ncbi:hypothetical protein FHX57_001970 [Paraburkholderia tropica]|uniref:hypothetical protein n=1 Tax=Paraburkholderia tropica TaxID=92647 RepID=UPI0016179CF6|nr:hypothetical protein [Paraburkholderia tropica]MBB2999639.1 hypothetical protein [Paraburkholderia tropica]
MNSLRFVIVADEESTLELRFGQYIQTAAPGVAADAAAAQAAAQQAVLSQNAAAVSEANSLTYKNAAGVSAANAATSEANALSYKNAASTSAANAATSEANSLTYQASASTSATLAQNWAAQASGTVDGSSYSAKYYASQASTSAANAAATLANALVKSNNLSDVANATTARGNLSAAKSGTNSDITALAGLTTPLSAAQGGTGVTTAAAELARIGAAATSGTLAQFAATTSAQLAGVLSDETGTGVAVFGTAPTLNQPVIKGQITGAVPVAGQIGEVIDSGIQTATLASATATNAATITLTPGDWDVYASVTFTQSGGSVMTACAAGISATSLTFPSHPYLGWINGSSMGNWSANIPSQNFNISANKQLWLVGSTNYTAGTGTYFARMWARRRA